MTNIQFLKNKIIIDGHAETKQECETITLLCDNLAKSEDFKTIRYERGYAEFEKVGKANDLKFAAARGYVTFIFDNTVVSVTNSYGTITTSGERLMTADTQEDTLTFVVALQEGYEIDTAVLVNDDSEALGTIDHYTSNTIYGNAGYGGLDGTVTITTKQSGSSNETWVFNETPQLPSSPETQTFITNFTSNGESYGRIDINNPAPNDKEAIYYNATPVLDSGLSWIDEGYRTIILEQSATGDLLAMLTKAAVKQTATPKQQIDLSTLSGWGNLSNGEHSITVKAKANGYNNSELSNSITVVKGSVVDGTWKATVSNLGSSNPENVSFELPVSNIKRPWSEITFNGDTFIKIQKMYRKVNSTSSNQITSFSISNTKIDNTYQIYPCFVDESGNELDYILIGKYMSNSTTECNSISSNGVVQKLENARNLARQRGTGYQLMDWRIHKLWQDLVICVYGKLNINDGTGVLIDKLGVYWGKTNDSWLSSAQFIDGCAITSYGNYRYSNYPSKYVNNPYASTDGYVEIEDYKLSYSNEYSNNENIHALGYSTNHPFFNYPKLTNKDNAYTTYYCEAFGLPSTSPAPIASYVGAAAAGAGAFSFYCKAMFGVSFGVRLCYRPIAS